MPSRTYLTKEEKKAPGFKVSKDRLTKSTVLAHDPESMVPKTFVPNTTVPNTIVPKTKVPNSIVPIACPELIVPNKPKIQKL